MSSWEEKQHLREKIAAQVEEYLAAGGVIEKIGIGVSGARDIGGDWRHIINAERDRRPEW